MCITQSLFISECLLYLLLPLMGYQAHLPPELTPLPCGNENQEQSPCLRGAEGQNKRELGRKKSSLRSVDGWKKR